MKPEKLFVFAAMSWMVSFAVTVAEMENSAVIAGITDVTASGACTMVDFETPAAKTAFIKQFRRPRVKIVNEFATSGKSALSVSWGRAHRTGFAIKIPETDFTVYDRLVIDVVNVGGTPDQLNLHIAAAGDKLDDSVYRANGMRSTLYAPVGKATWVVELDRWPKKAVKSRARVSELRFYALHPVGTTWVMDSIRLLKAGEVLVPGKYSEKDEKRIAAMVKDEMSKRDSLRRDTKKAFKKLAADSSVDVSGGMLAGSASSMEHVLPKDPAAFSGVKPLDALHVDIARGEYENLQIVVTPEDGRLERVGVRCAGTLTGGEGRVFAASNVACSVTGYSRTRYQAPYAVGRTLYTNSADKAGYRRRGYFPEPGWYPDVILDHVNETDIEDDVAQSFWVRVACPRDQAPGVYRGELVLSAGGKVCARVPFSVRVRNFTLPKTSALPVAMNFNPSGGMGWLPTNAEFAERTAAKKDPASPQNIWRKHHSRWVDFLADYLVPYDFLYRVRRAKHDPEPNWQALLRLKRQGRIAPFTLAYWGKLSNKKGSEERWRTKTLPYYRRICDKAKELGLLEYGFFYGNDECNPKDFPAIRRMADLIHKEFPGVPLFTTSRDVDFGVGTNSLENVEWFCPLTGRYDFERAEKARAKGRKVWWYVCDGPTWNCANLHIENKPIDARSLLGVQSLKFKADGFLYWQMAKWHSPRTIGADPFTDWVAASCFGFNGEGCITAAGPDGIPLPTVRLENFRDGLEDYAYAALLKKKIAESGNDDGWTRRAKALVAVPPSLVKALDCFSDDPQSILAWRREIADLIECR